MKKTTFTLLLWACFSLVNLFSQPTASTSWLGNTWGYGADKKWVQNYILALYVGPDGKCFTNSTWDEGHDETGIYKDGQKLGELSDGLRGLSVVGDGKYIFIHSGGVDKGGNVFEYDYKTQKFIKMIRVVQTAKIYDMAVKGDELYISNPNDNNILIFSISTGLKLREFPFERPSNIEADSNGNLWIVRSSYSFADKFINLNPYLGPSAIYCYSKNGVDLNKTITDVEFPSDLAMYPGNRLLVADWGKKQQVRCYKNLSTTPVLDASFFNNGTFGAENGILSGVKGEIKDDKFYRLSGIGADSTGNLYVNLGGPVPRWDNPTVDCDLREFNTSGKMLWQLYGKEFVDAGDLDPFTNTGFYTKDTHYEFNKNETTVGKEWVFKAFVNNDFDYPESPNSFRMGSQENNQKENVYARRLNGKLFLFENNQAGDQGALDIFRFDSINQGYTAIPCGRLARANNPEYPVNVPQTGDIEYLWKDINLDGKHDANEYLINSHSEYPFSSSYWPDKDGNIWKVYREQGIRKIPFLGISKTGIPEYSFEPRIYWQKPSCFRDVHYPRYIPEDDVMYLCGWVKRDNHCLNKDCPSQVGTIVKYKNWSTTQDSVWATELTDTAKLNVSECYDVAGDYIFVVISGADGVVQNPNCSVFVFNTSDGKYVTTIKPGSEVSSTGGWVDIWDGGVKAHKLPNGQYKIFVEEDWHSKTLVYTWAPKGVVDADIKITAPGNATYFLPNTNIDITIDAQCTSGIQKVEFLNGSSKIGEDNTSPYSYTWDAVPEGNYLLKARLISNANDTVYANNVSLFVMNKKPSVKITSPSEGMTFNNNDNVSVNVTATDDDGTIDSVLILQNGILIKKFTSGPYQTDVAVTCGSSGFSAIAYDNSGAMSTSSTVEVNAVPPGIGDGHIIRELYSNIPGTAISDLTSNPNFLYNPTKIDSLGQFEAPSDFADNYGQRIYGWLIPPETSDYTFWIASDDNSALYLSSDETPANKVEIAKVSGWSAAHQWNSGEQQSAVIHLEGAKKYYIEAIHKEGSGGDNVSVAWKGSCFDQSLIPGRYLSVYDDGNKAPVISITDPTSASKIYTGDSVTIKLSATDADDAIDSVQLFINAKKVITFKSVSYEYPWNNLSKGTYTITARAFDSRGKWTNATPDVVNVIDKGTEVLSKSIQTDVTLYPNPARGKIYLIFNNNHGKTQISINDILGKVLINNIIPEENGEINVSSLKDGIYLIRILINNTTVTKKLVISK